MSAQLALSSTVHTEASDAPAAVPMRIVWRYASATLALVVAHSMVIPLGTVELANQGVSATRIGLFAMLPMLGLLLGLPFTPRIHARFGRAHSFRAGAVMMALVFLGFAFAEGYWAWIVLASMMGIYGTLLMGLSDVLIAENAPEDRVGRATGLYQTLLALAIVLGPTIPMALSLSMYHAGLLGALIALGALLSVLSLPSSLIAVRGGAASTSLLSVLRGLSPFMLFAAFVGGVFETGLHAVSVVKAIHVGFVAATAGLIVGVIAAGSFAVQYPLGVLTDRLGVHRLIFWSGLLLMGTALALLLVRTIPGLLWPIAALWGALGGALQTLVYIHIGKTNRDGSAAAAISAMFIAYTLGCLVGPGIGGVILDFLPTWGLAVTLAMVAMSLSLIPMLQKRHVA